MTKTETLLREENTILKEIRKSDDKIIKAQGEIIACLKVLLGLHNVPIPDLK